MIKRLLIILVAMVAHLGIQAITISSESYSEFNLGEVGSTQAFYLYNVTTGQFLNTVGNNENSTLSDVPTATTTFTACDNGTVLISGNSGKYLKLGTYKGQYLWSDGNESSTRWTIAAVEGEENVYTIAGLNGNYSATNISGDWYIIGTNASNSEDAVSLSRWAFITETAYKAVLEAANNKILNYCSEVSAGAFYLYNMDEGQFLIDTGGDPYLSATPAEVTIKQLDNGQYTIGTNDYFKMGVYGGRYLWSNTWSDSEYFKWNFDILTNKMYNLSVSISTEKTEGGYIFTVGKHYLNTPNIATTTQANAQRWVLITPQNWVKYTKSYTRDFNTAYNYGTIYLPFAPDTETCKKYTFYKIKSYSDNVLIFEEENSPQANSAYLYSAVDKEATSHTFTGSEIEEPVAEIESDGWNFIGTFEKTKIEGLSASNDLYYAYIPTDGKDVLVKATNSITISPYRAYFKYVQSVNTTFVPATMRMVIGGDANAIEEIFTSEQIEDMATPVIYDLMGRSVQQMQKGQIYIINGKKMRF